VLYIKARREHPVLAGPNRMLYLLLEAFFSREPGATSLENAIGSDD